MRKAAIIPIAASVVPPPQPVVAAIGPQPGQPPTPGMNAMSDQEVRERMARVADEIRRRRAMRREALENAQNPQAVRPGQPQQ